MYVTWRIEFVFQQISLCGKTNINLHNYQEPSMRKPVHSLHPQVNLCWLPVKLLEDSEPVLSGKFWSHHHCCLNHHKLCWSREGEICTSTWDFFLWRRYISHRNTHKTLNGTVYQVGGTYLRSWWISKKISKVSKFMEKITLQGTSAGVCNQSTVWKSGHGHFSNLNDIPAHGKTHLIRMVKVRHSKIQNSALLSWHVGSNCCGNWNFCSKETPWSSPWDLYNCEDHSGRCGGSPVHPSVLVMV